MIKRIKALIRRYINRITGFFMLDEKAGQMANPLGANPTDIEEVQAALKKWHTSRKFFESVSDPDLIDYAIFDMESARRRYALLVKNAKTAEYETTNEHTDVSV